MKTYRIKTKAGVYAGNNYRVDRYGEMRPSGFAPVKNAIFARVYTEEDTLQIRADIMRLAQFVRESIEEFTLEEVA